MPRDYEERIIENQLEQGNIYDAAQVDREIGELEERLEESYQEQMQLHAAVIAAARPICEAILNADALGQHKIKLDDVIEDAVHLGIALAALDEQPGAAKETPHA
jgi:hypothetical protein